MYLKAPAADQEERDLGLARARFHLGGCLLKTGMDEDGLAETEAGLELAADVLDRLRIQFADNRLARRGAPLPATGRAGLGGRRGQVNDAARGGGPLAAGRDGGQGGHWRVRRPRGTRRRRAPRRARENQRQGGGDPRNEKRARPTWNTHPFGMNPSILMASAVKSPREVCLSCLRGRRSACVSAPPPPRPRRGPTSASPRPTCRAPGPCRPRRSAGSPGGRTRARR